MKRLLIVGAGGFGREMFVWCSQHPDCGRVWSIGGFLDERADTLAGFDYPVGIVGGIDDFRPGSDDLLVCALGQPATKRRVCARLLERGAKFLTFVHPSVMLGRNVSLGRGAVLCPGVVLTCDIFLDDFVMINVSASAGHDVRVGAWTTVSGHSDITGHCRVGEGVFFGSHATVIPGRKIGDRAVVAAGSVIITHVRPGVTMVGNPARALVWHGSTGRGNADAPAAMQE